MNFLLDTNVVSEWVKPHPDPGVMAWLADVDEDRVFIRVITLSELRHGVERMNDGRRRKRLDEWLRNGLPLRFDGRGLAHRRRRRPRLGRRDGAPRRRRAAHRPD